MEMPTAWSPKFGGISMTAERYSDVGRERAYLFIQDARKILGDLPQGYLKGTRYNSDLATFSYLESGADEVEFFKDPLLMAIGALLGAAASDHWYTYEKDWGSDEHASSDDDGDDCEVEE